MENADVFIEKRRYPRVLLRLSVAFQVLTKWAEVEKALVEAGEQGQALDLSQGGLAMVSRRRLRKMDVLRMRVKIPGGGESLDLTAEVMSCVPRPDEPGTYRVGLHFLGVEPRQARLLDRWMSEESLAGK